MRFCPVSTVKGSRFLPSPSLLPAIKPTPATALKGINLLVDAGIVYKKRGIGMFVSQGALQLLKEKRQDEFFQQYVLPMVQEAKRLSIQPETLRDWIERGFAE